MTMKPTCTSSKLVHQNPWYKVRHDELVWPNGKPGNYYVAEFNGAATAICIQDGKILTVTQYRYTVDEKSLELPMGTIEPGEDPTQVALRELAEETGVVAKTATSIGTFHGLNGSCRHIMHVFLITDIISQGQKQSLDDGEFDLTTEWMDIHDWRQAIREGRVKDGESLAAWAMYQEWLAKE